MQEIDTYGTQLCAIIFIAIFGSTLFVSLLNKFIIALILSEIFDSNLCFDAAGVHILFKYNLSESVTL